MAKITTVKASELVGVLEREAAIEEAIEAFGIERVYHNHYRCEECAAEWDSDWSCACDDECAGCGRDMSPYAYEVEGEEEDDG